MRRRNRVGRPALAGLLLAAALLGSGCVYWRLHQLRSQLADFETNFAVTHEPGAVIRFQTPVLKPDDIAWLIGLEPIRSGTTTGPDTSTYIFQIRTPGRAAADESAWDIRAELIARDGRIVEVRAQERFNDILNTTTITRAFRGAVGGNVNSRDKETGWALDKDLIIPSEDRVIAMLGPPVERFETDLHRVLDYRYDLAPVGDDDRFEAPDFTARFVVDRETGRVVEAFNRIGALSIRVTDMPEVGYKVFLRRQIRNLE